MSRQITDVFELQKAVAHLCQERTMAALIDRVGVLDFAPDRLSPFESITRAIIHQQLNGKAAGTILGRFKRLFDGERFPSPEEVLAIEPAKLLTAGLSRAKTAGIRDLAAKASDGLIPSLRECDAMTEEELVDRFTAVRGVGRWTVEMMLIFNLGRQDVLPVHDLGVRRGYQLTFRKRALPSPERLQKLGRPWAPYRTTAALYLWRAVDTGTG